MAGSAPIAASVSAIVLAGGQSSRLGVDKAFLPVGGQPLVARTVQTLAGLSDDVIVVANDRVRYEALGLPARIVSDERPGEGSLMGLYSGLGAARHDVALAVACDMPFLRPPFLRYLLSLSPDHDAVVPRLGSLLEPLHAVYARTCLPLMAASLNARQRRIIAFFPQARIRYVEEDEIDRLDPRHLSFMNVNTPEDWEQVQTLLQG